MTNSATYWNQRVQQYGHTGFSVSPIYWLEQLVRARSLKAILRKHTLLNRKIRVLDFGCGDATLSSSVLRSQCSDLSYTGYDISTDVLVRASARFHASANVRAEFTSDINNILTSKYDLIIAVTVFQHIPDCDLRHLLPSLYRSLRKGGLLVILDNCYPHKIDHTCMRTGYNRDELIAFYSTLLGTQPVDTYPHITNVLSFLYFFQNGFFRIPLSSSRLSRYLYAAIFMPFLMLSDMVGLRILPYTYTWSCYMKR